MKLNLFLPLTKVDVKERVVYGVAAVEEPDKSGEIFDYATSAPNFKKWSSEFEKTTDGKSLGNVRAMHGKVAAGKLNVIEFDEVNKAITVAAKIVDDNEWNKVLEGVYTGFSIGGSYEKRWKDGELHRYTATPSEISIVDNPCMPSATFSMVKMDGSTEDVAFKVPVAAVEKKLPSNDEVAAKARELAKAAGNEIKWFDHIQAATDELTKALNPEPVVEPVVEEAAAELAKTAEPTPANPEPELAQVWQSKDGKTFAKKADAIAHNTELAKVAADADSPAAKLAASLAKLDSTLTAKEAPVAEVVKEFVPTLVTKGMYQVSRLASMIDDLNWLLCDCKWEADAEGDKSKVPASLKQNLSDLINTLRSMVKEETQEVLDSTDLEMAAKPLGFDALVKSFEGDDATLGKLNALLAKVAPPVVEKTEPSDDLQKALAAKDEVIASLNKTISDTATSVDALVKRVETLENSPVPGGPRATDTFRVVEKTDDTSGIEKLAAMAKDNPGAIVDQLVRLAQQNPQRYG